MNLTTRASKFKSRRSFFKSTIFSLASGGILVGVPTISGAFGLAGCKFLKRKSSGFASVPSHGFGPFIKISAEGKVSVVCDKSEMGQGVTSLFCSLVAEELEINSQLISYEFAPAEEVYINRRVVIPLYVAKVPVHAQITGLSSSTSDVYEKMRLAAAAAKQALQIAALKKFGLPQTQIEQTILKEGKVVHLKSGQAASFGELAQASGPISEEFFKRYKLGSYKKQEGNLPAPKANLRFLGKVPPQQPGKSADFLRVDAFSKINGSAVFGIDVLPKHTGHERFLFAVVVRGREIGSSVSIQNNSEVQSLPNVKHVVSILNGRGVAVVASTTWHAISAARQVKLNVTPGKNVQFSTEGESGIVQKYLNAFDNKTPNVTKIPVVPSIGIENQLRETIGAIEAKYVVPYVPHSTLEPMNCVAFLDGGIWTVWAPTQFPEAALAAVSRAAGVPESRCRVVTTLIGGGFGRRLVTDYIMEAVSVSKLINGQPVKLIWTREDDTRHDYFRPVAVHKMLGSPALGGEPAANSRGGIKHEIMSQSINSFVVQDYIACIVPDKLKNQKLLAAFARIGAVALNNLPLDPFSVEGAYETHYDFQRHNLVSGELTGASVPAFPIGYWRSVGHSHTAFAIECFIDEMCSENSVNAIEFRKNCLHKNSRALGVLQRVLQISGYNPSAQKTSQHKTQVKNSGTALHRAKGFACHSGWGSSVAAVADVSVDVSTGAIVVHEFWVVVDCGFVVQPDIVKQQVEGGIIFGLSAALKQEITVINGVVQQSNFHDCDILRYHESPKINVEINQQPANVNPTGVGELPVPVAAPAVANAVANATGMRLRRMPFTPVRVIQALGVFLMFIFNLQARSDGKTAFDYLHSVASHPRCVNCHGILKNGEHVPTVGNGPVLQPHPMRITSVYPNLGGDCITCHQKENIPLVGAPPGAANNLMKDFLWQMPPTTMILKLNIGKKELCEIWTNPQKNAGKNGDRGGVSSPEALAKMRKEFMHHVSDDPLVHWAFQPGIGRTAAPGSREQLISAMDSWIGWLEQGNRCGQLSN
jgi:isoquinoline 1-oxidoreductase subunit beta